MAGPALAGFAASAAGIAGPAIIALKIGMKGLADGAAEFNSKFADADEAMNKLVGQRMGPMLEAFHTMRSEMVDRFSAELTPAFSAVGVAIDRVRGNFGWMSVILGQIGQDMGKAFASDEVVYGIDSMGLASKKFFQQFNKDQSGIAELTKGIFAYLGTAADTFANYGQGLNQVFYNFGKSLQDTDVDQITGAFSGFKQVLSNVGNVVGPLFIAFRQLGAISAKAMAPGFVAIGQAIRDATPGLLNMARVIMPAIGEVMQRLAPLIPALVQAFTPWATVLATIGPPLATVVAHMAPLAPYLLMAATAFRVAGAAMLLWNAATFAGSVAQGVFAAATGRSAATLAGNTIALTAHRIALIAGAVAARAFGAAMAFATGPIGLTIAAVAAIGVALWAFFTKTETGKKLWEKIWPAIKTAVQVAWQYIRVAWDGILAGLGWIGDKATWLWGAMQPVFQAIGSLISWWWTSIVQPAFSGMMTALGWLGTAISWWWQNIVTPAFTAVSNIISWWWSNIVGPAFTAAKAAFGFLGDAISWWWTSIVQPAFSAAGAVLSWFWNDIGSPIFNNFKAIIGLVGDAISWWWNSIAVPAFQAVGAVMSWLWDNVGSPVFDNLKSGVGLVGEAFSFFKDNVVDPVFDGIGTAISFAWDNVVSPVFDKLKSGVGLVGDAFGAAGGVIKTMWSGVADTLRPAVHALGNILAGVPDSIGPIEIPGAGTAKALGQKLQSFNTGGLAVGPGTGTSDSILAAISNGEFIVRARYAKQYLPLLEAINNGLPLPAYAGGGLVDVQNWLRGEAGKPYQYGGTGNPSWDCSGIAGGVWGKVTGKSPNARYFTTDSDFAALGWKSGAGGATDLTIGTNGGSGTGGHMSGRLGDLKFESSGSDGVEVGAGAQDPSSFAQQWHWPVGGNPTTGGLTTGGGTGGSGGTTGGLGSGGASGGASGDASSAGASTSRPSGTAVPVWVDNWPSNLGGASASTSADTSTTTSSGGGTTTTTSDSTDTAYDQASAVNTALSKFSTAMTSAGNTALSGQKSAIPGVGGYVEDIEKTVNNWNIVVADVYEAVSAFSREQKRQTAGK
ncbi:phage tail protein [Nocardia sp. NPDC003999]